MGVEFIKDRLEIVDLALSGDRPAGCAAGGRTNPVLVGIDVLAEQTRCVRTVRSHVGGERPGDHRIGVDEHVVQTNPIVRA